MKESQGSSFQFKGFRVTHSLIDIKDVEGDKKLSIAFNPKGVIDKKESAFTLFLNVSVSDISKSLNIEMDAEAKYLFNYNESSENLNNYFYINAPAILFPYLRAYISALTALSGVPTITLPTLNLTSLGDDLKDNTEVKEDTE